MKKSEINSIISSMKRQRTATLRDKIWKLTGVIYDRKFPKNLYFYNNEDECCISEPLLTVDHHLTEYTVELSADYKITYGRLWGYSPDDRYACDYICDNMGNRLNVGDIRKIISGIETLIEHRHDPTDDSYDWIDGLDDLFLVTLMD